MDSKDVVAIIKAAKDSGLKYLEIGELKLVFENLTNLNDIVHNSPRTVPFNETQNVEDITDIDEVPEVDELLNDFSMAIEMAQDPVEFEKRQRELNNGR